MYGEVAADFLAIMGWIILAAGLIGTYIVSQRFGGIMGVGVAINAIFWSCLAMAAAGAAKNTIAARKLLKASVETKD